MLPCILAVLSEVSGKDFLGATGKLKALTSDLTLTINKKGVPEFEVLSYHRFLCVTNTHAASPNEKGNHRMMDLKCSGEMHEMEGSKKYFKRSARSVRWTCCWRSTWCSTGSHRLSRFRKRQ